MAHCFTVVHSLMAAASIVTPRITARALGALFTTGMLATSAAGLDILETFDGGFIHTHNGSTVIWEDGLVPWGPGTSPGIFLPGDEFWQAGDPYWTIFQGIDDSLLTLIVKIGPAGGTLSFDYDGWLSGVYPDTFAVFLDNSVIVAANDQFGGRGVTAALLPGTRTIKFNLALNPGSFIPPEGGAGIDNVRVTGIVPEPASALLLAAGGFWLLFRRRGEIGPTNDCS